MSESDSEVALRVLSNTHASKLVWEWREDLIVLANKNRLTLYWNKLRNHSN